MRRSRPPDTAWIQRVTAWYLERYGTSIDNLRRVLRARVRRKVRALPEPSEALVADGLALIEPELARLQALGLLDDERYAADKARVIGSRGGSHQRIRASLAAKGVPRGEVDAALEDVDEDASADAWLRRRRLGPYRPSPPDADALRKETARMLRAGYRYDLVRRLMRPADDGDEDL